jgi:hypothetical protein
MLCSRQLPQKQADDYSRITRLINQSRTNRPPQHTSWWPVGVRAFHVWGARPWSTACFVEICRLTIRTILVYFAHQTNFETFIFLNYL